MMILWTGLELLLPGVLLAAVIVACFFRRGRRIVAWTMVGAMLLSSGIRLAREAGNIVHGRGWGALERAGWRWVSDACRVWQEGWSWTYELGAEGMSRGWVGLTAWAYPNDMPEPYHGKLRLEWLDGDGRTVRESVVGAEGPEGLAFLPPAEGRDGPPNWWTLPLEQLDMAWVAERERNGGLKLRMTVEEADDRNTLQFCVWLARERGETP